MLPVLCLIGFCALVVKHGKTDLAAYRAGKEAPSIEKFRKRHEARQKWLDGERKLTSPSKQGGKEPGPMRKWFRAVRDNAADELIEKQNHKSQARREWYRRNADQHEQQWQTKWQGKLDKRERKVRQWGEKKGVIDPAGPEPAEDESAGEQSGESPAPPQQPQSGEPQPTKSDEPLKIQFPTVDMGERISQLAEQDRAAKAAQPQPTEPAEPTFGTGSASGTPATATPTGGTVHEQGAQELRESADEVRQFCDDMDGFADGLGGRRYGNEITGLAGEISKVLDEATGIYADLAEQIQQQGDDVRDAHDSTDHQIPDDAAMA